MCYLKAKIHKIELSVPEAASVIFSLYFSTILPVTQEKIPSIIIIVSGRILDTFMIEFILKLMGTLFP